MMELRTMHPRKVQRGYYVLTFRGGKRDDFFCIRRNILVRFVFENMIPKFF